MEHPKAHQYTSMVLPMALIKMAQQTQSLTLPTNSVPLSPRSRLSISSLLRHISFVLVEEQMDAGTPINSLESELRDTVNK